MALNMRDNLITRTPASQRVERTGCVLFAAADILPAHLSYAQRLPSQANRPGTGKRSRTVGQTGRRFVVDPRALRAGRSAVEGNLPASYPAERGWAVPCGRRKPVMSGYRLSGSAVVGDASRSVR